MSKTSKSRTWCLIPVVLLLLGACGSTVSGPEVDIPADIYDDEVWDDADIEVRVAALRRDIRAELEKVKRLSAEGRESESQRLLELMSILRAEWGKLEGGAHEYAKLEEDIEALLDG